MLPPAAHGGPRWRRYPHCRPWKTPCQSRWMCPERRCPSPAHTGADSWQDLWPMERSSHRTIFSGRTYGPRWRSLCLKDCTPWKGRMLEKFLKNRRPWEGPTLEKFIKNPTLEQRESIRRKEWQRQHIMNWPRPPYLVLLCRSGGGGREEGSEVELGKKGRVGGGWLQICSCFSLSYSVINWQ